MSLKICCIPTKELFYDNISGYRIISCEPKGYYKDLQLNKYNNFTLNGNNLESLKINEEANLLIELDTTSNYSCSYMLIGYVGMETEKDKIVVKSEYEVEILSRYMEKSQAININKAYPNFIELILNNKEKNIDCHNIKNVGNKRLVSYIEKIKKDCKNILFFPIAIKLGINNNDMISILSTNFNSTDEMLNLYKINPYYIYIDLLEMNFIQADELIINKLPEFIDSPIRCEYACIEILNINESKGNTRLNANILASQVKILAPETRNWIVNTVTNNSKFYYDTINKNVSLKTTYEAEKNIANHVLNRLSNNTGYKMNWEKYQSIDNIKYTNEQMEILKIVGNGNKISLLTGSAGCVDCDTEFFTGKGWKKIVDYQKGDMVLQYNQDGTGEIVKPERYLKIPCNTMWHLTNNNMVDFMVCNEHRIIYWYNEEQRECKIADIYNNINWTGFFKTTFNYSGKGINISDDKLKMFENFTSEWYNCNKHQLEVICKKIKTEKQFISRNKELADFIQFAFACCGYGMEILPINKTYLMSYYKSNYVKYNYNNKSIKKSDTKDGYKYCFTVPSGMLVLRRNNCIFITGNCGKTTSVNVLLKMLEDNNKEYTLLAPTGIAAKRLNIATDKYTSTIHMFLTHLGHIGEYVIIDEFSMVGVHLLSKLLKYIGLIPNLIFVCDNAQLVSISCGNIIQDLLDVNIIPRANLTKVFRYGSSGLSTIATDVRNGEMKYLHKEYNDFKFLPVHSFAEQIVNTYLKMLSKGYKKDEILILSPYNTGEKGTYIINNIIQDKFNLNEFTPFFYKKQKTSEIKFKIGDRVLNTVNNYNMPCLKYDENGEEIFGTFSCMNGDCGIIREYRVIDNKPCLIIKFDNGLGILQGKNLSNLLLGYSITIHRAQGVEFKAVIIVIDKEHKQLLSNNLLYVALSRAKENMILIGNEEIINEALKIKENKERNTNLKDFLKGCEEYVKN